MSVNCCVENIPKTIKKALGCGEKVIFKGSYDISTINVTGNVVTNKAFFCKNKNGYNFYNDIFYYTKNNELGAPFFSN